MWKHSEIDFVLKNYTELGAAGCAKQIGRTADAVFNKAGRLGIRNKKNIVIDGQKKCSRCKLNLPTSEFHKSKTFRSGFNSFCKFCYKLWCENNSETEYKRKKKYRDAHRSELSTAKNIYNKSRLENCPAFRVRTRIARRILHALNGHTKSAKTLELLGCSAEDFKTYLELNFLVGMTWENYGKKWQIDHKIPCSAFDLTLPAEQRKCFHYSNTQPLWKLDNLRKGNRLKGKVFTWRTSSQSL